MQRDGGVEREELMKEGRERMIRVCANDQTNRTCAVERNLVLDPQDRGKAARCPEFHLMRLKRGNRN